MTLKQLVVGALLALSLTGVAACGSSGTATPGGGTQSVPLSTESGTASGQGGSSSQGASGGAASGASTGGAGAAAGTGQLCASLQKAVTAAGSINGGTDPSSFGANLDKAISVYRSIAQDAPSDVSAAANRIADAFEKIKSAGSTPNAAVIAQQLQSIPSDVQTISAYLVKNCTSTG